MIQTIALTLTMVLPVVFIMIGSTIRFNEYKEIIRLKNISIAMFDVERDYNIKFMISLLKILEKDHPDDESFLKSKIKLQQFCERTTEGNLKKAMEFLKENADNENVKRFLKDCQNV